MDERTLEQLTTKVASLERRLRVYSIATYGLCTLLAVGAMIPMVDGQEDHRGRVLRARGIVIEDERGRDRILIGAPVPNPKDGTRISPSTGFVINDPDGYERFGLGLKADGAVGMGFDAPRGTGDDRNRERINIVADGKGSAYLRFLNRKTQAAAFLRLGDDDQFSIEFLKFVDQTVLRRRLTFDDAHNFEERR